MKVLYLDRDQNAGLIHFGNFRMVIVDQCHEVRPLLGCGDLVGFEQHRAELRVVRILLCQKVLVFLSFPFFRFRLVSVEEQLVLRSKVGSVVRSTDCRAT